MEDVLKMLSHFSWLSWIFFQCSHDEFSFLFLYLGVSKVSIFLTNLLIRENSNETASRKQFLTAGGIHVFDLSSSTKILVGIGTVVH